MSTSTHTFDVILGVPSDCSGSFAGCQFMPSALRAAGLVEAVGAEDAGNLQVVMADPRRDPETGVVGLDDLLNLSAVVRDGTQELLAAGRTPLLVGGDCTLLIGVAAAIAATHPNAGLLFIDGHLDCFDGHSSPTGEGADMELAVLLGHGAQPLLDFGARTPAFSDDRVVVLGPFDEADAAALGSPDPRQFAPRTRIVGVDELALNPSEHVRSALAALEAAADGFWLHLDLDVLSSDELPAVDYPDPRGLTFDELRSVLRPAFASPHLIGASVAILNPTLDTADGDCANRVVELLAATLPR
ncbi:arginase family protein [Mycolicibacterium sp. CH28]|uniref:arginase family protein n=1 Tax=Mycolicibacterium sp. CH28 TaxID=2512237 RepID=UPI001081BB02|nr:arginase family protein [Mycolicibacterium sp. CH28]TGD89735.1 arginase family protein [Mycolicibacterium sp. CH28]